jgi:hypothetical protein
MKLRLSKAAVMLSVLVLSAGAARAQEAQAEQLPPMMIPTPQHAEMARDVGVWDGESTAWEAPGGEPQKTTCVETNAMIGKMWLDSRFEGEYGGDKFVGKAQMGWDPVKKKYVGTWIDSISPFMYMLEGEYDIPTHTLTVVMTGTSALTGKPETAKNITRYIDENTKVFEMHMPVEGKPGEWWKMMEIKYTRRK